MNKSRDLFSKTSVVVIIFLFIGMSIVSSTDNIVKYNNTNYKLMKSNYEFKEELSSGKIAYAYNAYCESIPEGPVYFDLDDPGIITLLAPTESTYFLSGGTWSCDEIWYGCEYGTGRLWTINTDNGEMENIGGGGISCNGLSWNPLYNRLYGASDTHLIEYNPETGEQETIGSFGVSNTIISLAINSEGVAYIWDILFSGPSTLWTVDLETGVATEVCNFPIALGNGDGCFDYDTDILYITSENQLFEFDLDTGNWSLIGDFEGGAEITCLAIPYTFNQPPVTNISFNPQEPDGENDWYVSNVTVTLNAYDEDGVNVTYYRINSEEWKKYTEPFTLSEDGEDILIEYYSVDNTGNVEDVKHITVDIDQTKPDIDLYYEIIGGNKWNGWDILLTAYAEDDMSGMERVEFYYKDKLQGTINGTEPYYECVIKMYLSDFYFYSYFVRGLICNLEITEEFVNFYSIITFIRPKNWEGPPKMYAIAYDLAGNYEFDEIKNPCSSTNITPGFYLFRKLTLPNNYTGHVGRFYISATFDMS